MRTRTAASRLLAAAMCVALAVLTGCTHAPPAPAPATTTAPPGFQVPDNIHFSEHWIPTPGVDLMSADGTFIRAFAESSTLRNFSAPFYDESDWGYPGFARANQTSYRWLRWKVDAYGYTTQRIMRVEESSDGTVAAFICSYTSINPMNKDAPATSGVMLRYHRTGTPPPTNQKGPGRAPTVSVFGDWYATYWGLKEGETLAESATWCRESEPVIDKRPESTPGWPNQTGE